MRWAAGRLVRMPLVWGWLVASSLGWIALQAFRPLAIIPTEIRQGSLFYELAFMSALLGATVGLQTLETARPLLARGSPLGRWSIKGVLLLVAQVAFLPGILLALALNGLEALESVRLLQLVFLLLHLTGMALFVSALPWRGATRPWLQGALLWTLAWLLPAFVPEGLSRWMSPIFAGDPGSTAFDGPCGPILAWTFLSLLIEPRTPSR